MDIGALLRIVKRAPPLPPAVPNTKPYNWFKAPDGIGEAVEIENTAETTTV